MSRVPKSDWARWLTKQSAFASASCGNHWQMRWRRVERSWGIGQVLAVRSQMQAAHVGRWIVALQYDTSNGLELLDRDGARLDSCLDPRGYLDSVAEAEYALALHLLKEGA